MSGVWIVSATGVGIDRVCDSRATGMALCDDLNRELGGSLVVIEDWANHNVPEAPERWARYVQSRTGGPTCQSVAEHVVDTEGRWFRAANRPLETDEATS